MDDLKLIASLTPGYTICVTSKSIVFHKSWGTSMYRTWYGYWYGEGRKKTLDWIETCISEAINKNAEFESTSTSRSRN